MQANYRSSDNTGAILNDSMVAHHTKRELSCLRQEDLSASDEK